MKTLHYILLLLTLSACSTAQTYKLIEATQTTKIGGVKGSRTENFNIIVKNNLKLEAKYLLLGEVKIPLNKEVKNGMIHYSGIYFPENIEEANFNGATSAVLNFNSNNAYLVSENVKSKKIIKREEK